MQKSLENPGKARKSKKGQNIIHAMKKPRSHEIMPKRGRIAIEPQNQRAIESKTPGKGLKVMKACPSEAPGRALARIRAEGGRIAIKPQNHGATQGDWATGRRAIGRAFHNRLQDERGGSVVICAGVKNNLDTHTRCTWTFALVR